MWARIGIGMVLACVLGMGVFLIARPDTLHSPPDYVSFRTRVSEQAVDGEYQVGVNLAAGTYRTENDSDRTCYYRVTSSRGIRDEGYGEGAKTVRVRRGEYFSTEGCGGWHLVR